LFPKKKLATLTASFVLLTMVVLPLFVSAEDNDNVPEYLERDLAEQYAPILYLHPDEIYHPISVSYCFENSVLMQAGSNTTVDQNPSASTIGAYNIEGMEYYLDNQRGTVEDDGIEKHWKDNRDLYDPTVYARVTSMNDGGGEMHVIQYWFYYAFNQGTMNTHEGDWEMITIIKVPEGDVRLVGYSQHMEGEKTEWTLIDKEGDNPKVYVALGSHANYLRPYEGGLGLANDKVSDQGKVLSLKDYDLVLLGERGDGNHPSDQSWLDFAGYWGEYGSLESGIRGERGPQGPAFFQDKARWDDAANWVHDLNEVDETWFQLNWFVANLVNIVLFFMFITLVIHALLKYRLKKKQGTLGPRLLPLLYIDGANAKSIGMLFGILAMIFALIGFFLPWYIVTLDIDAGIYNTGGAVDLMTINGMDGFTFNTLDADSGMTQVISFPVAFIWLMLAGLGLFLFKLIGIRESRSVGKKFIGRGIKTLIPVFIILIVVVFITSLVSSYGSDTNSDLEELMDAIGSNPAGGEAKLNFDSWGTGEMTWGLGTGAYMFIIAMVMYMISAMLLIKADTNLYSLHPRESRRMEPQQQGEVQYQGQPQQQYRGQQQGFLQQHQGQAQQQHQHQQTGAQAQQRPRQQQPAPPAQQRAAPRPPSMPAPPTQQQAPRPQAAPIPPPMPVPPAKKEKPSDQRQETPKGEESGSEQWIDTGTEKQTRPVPEETPPEEPSPEMWIKEEKEDIPDESIQHDDEEMKQDEGKEEADDIPEEQWATYDGTENLEDMEETDDEDMKEPIEQWDDSVGEKWDDRDLDKEELPDELPKPKDDVKDEFPNDDQPDEFPKEDLPDELPEDIGFPTHDPNLDEADIAVKEELNAKDGWEESPSFGQDEVNEDLSDDFTDDWQETLVQQPRVIICPNCGFQGPDPGLDGPLECPNCRFLLNR